jgi:hypothetical protein
MWINLPEWLCIIISVLFVVNAISTEVLKCISSKYAKAQAEREVEIKELVKQIAELEIEKIRLLKSFNK